MGNLWLHRRYGPALALGVATLLGACVRDGPPAPVVHGAAGVPRTQAPPAPPPSATLIVAAGDSLAKIAKRENVPLRALIDANQISPPYRIHPGQALIVPRNREHVVQGGDSLYGVATRYDVDAGKIVRVNEIAPPYTLTAGQLLALPERSPSAATDALPVVVATPLPPVPPAPPASITERSPPPRDGAMFQWPLRGKILANYGPREKGFFNDGINIAAAAGTPVHAAENGVVAYAGNELKGFGNLLLIKHADGWVTAYAHNDVLLVQRGETVRRGQQIARVGATGGVNQPQLHFEIRRGARSVDPNKHLGRATATVSAERPTKAAGEILNKLPGDAS